MKEPAILAKWPKTSTIVTALLFHSAVVLHAIHSIPILREFCMFFLYLHEFPLDFPVSIGRLSTPRYECVLKWTDVSFTVCSGLAPDIPGIRSGYAATLTNINSLLMMNE